MKRLGRSALALSTALLPLLPILYAVVGGGCVDGVTPNCADPNIQCGVDGAADRVEAALLPEASRLDSAEAEAAVDAPADGDLDAGDEG